MAPLDQLIDSLDAVHRSNTDIPPALDGCGSAVNAVRSPDATGVDWRRDAVDANAAVSVVTRRRRIWNADTRRPPRSSSWL